MKPVASTRVERSFSRSFAAYHDAARQQARSAQKLVDTLATTGAPARFQRVLELGCGTGHLTRALTEGFEIDALSLNDISPKAEATATAFAARFLWGDAARVDWPQTPDLIASASMIQWLPDPAPLLSRAIKTLRPGGYLALSGFGPRQYEELTALGSTAAAPGLCTAERLAERVRGPLDIVATGEEVQPIRFATPRDVLTHLRQTGVNGRAQKGWTKAKLRQFSEDYHARFGTAEGVSLTYHPVWIIARKPLARS